MTLRSTALAVTCMTLIALAVGCGDATPVDPKPAGPPDTRLKPAENGKGSPTPAPAVRGD
jgi:hypothetical protein